MSDGKNNIDGFWDISSLIPKKKTILRKPVSDAEAVTIDTGNSSHEQGEDVPNVVNRTVKTIHRQKIEYSSETGFIRKVELIPWGSFTFYSKFRADAEKYFDAKSDECEYEYFFSYMPQYEQMSIKQMKYYLFWRAQVRDKIYPPVDSSYIFLYIYETINLNDIISAEERLEILFDILAAYRGRYPYLDRYIGEWICDICLIERISPPEKMRGVLRETSQKISLPEVFANSDNGYFSYDFICSVSGYDHKKSKAYADNKQEWDKYLPEVIEKAIGAYIDSDEIPQVFSHTIRDSFSGAIAYSGIKYKIAVTYLSVRKSKDIHTVFATISKFAENELRAACGVKSRYKTAKIPLSAEKAVKEFFDGSFPQRHLRKKSTDEGENEEYMKYYAPRRVGEADIARALRIEEAAWDTARLLEAEIDKENDIPVDAPGAPPKADALAARRDDENEFISFLSSLDEALFCAVKAAVNCELKQFCKSHSMLKEDVIRRINEIAYEAIGDMIIDDSGEIIEDYLLEIETAIKEKEEN